MYPGVYCTEHIVFLILTALVIAAGLILVRKFADTEKKERIVIRASAAFLLFWIVLNRTSVTCAQIASDPESYSWINLIPYTFCGLASLVYSVSALIRPKDNPIYHFISYFGCFGGTITMFYPDFLETQTFWDVRSFSGLMHHALMIWLTLLVLSTRHFRPDIKKIWIYPLGYCAVMTLGLFEEEVLGFIQPMNIGAPLLSSAPVLTSWYTIFAASTAVAAVIALIFTLADRKKAAK